jgi:hypothetical protein
MMCKLRKYLCFAIYALAFAAFGAERSFADGTFPGLLQPGQILGNNGATAAPAAAITPWAAAAPAGILQLYASPTGNDTNNSCMASETPCTLKGACAARTRIATFLSNDVAINLADGTYSSVDGSGNLCSIVGNGGGSSLNLTTLIGNVSNPTNVILAVPASSHGLDIEDAGTGEVKYVEITGGNGSVGIYCRQLAICDYQNVTWGVWGTGGSHVAITVGASANLVGGGETLLNNFNVHWNLSDGAHFNAGGVTHIPSALTWNVFAIATNSNIDISGWSHSGSGDAGSTGAPFIGGGSGFLSTPGNAACNGGRWPGSGNCQLLQGYQDSAGDALTSPWPAADLPTPTASTLGGVESKAAVSHQFLTAINTDGSVGQAQPAVSDLSGSLRQTIGGSSTAGTGSTVATNTTTFACNANAAGQNSACTAALAGSFKNFYFSALNAPGAGHTYTLTFSLGTYGSIATTSITCQIANTATSCSDQFNITGDAATITAGQAYGVKIVTDNGAATLTGWSWGIEFDNP